MGDFSIGGVIEISLRQLNEARQTIRDVGEEMQATFDRIASDAQSALDVFGGLGGFSAGSLAVFSEVDDAIKAIEASTQSLENVTFDVGNTFNDVYLRAGQQGAEAVADAIRLSAQSLELISDSAAVAAGDVEFVSEAALGLSNTFENLDADQAILSITNLMDNFGISAQEASDLLATAMSGSLGSADDLADTLIEYPRYFKDLGFSADEFFAVLESGADAFGTDVIADAFKEFNIIIQERSDEAIAALNTAFSSVDVTDLANELGKIAPELDGAYDVTTEKAQILLRAMENGLISEKEFFDQTLEGVSQIGSEVKRNSVLVELFGTKAEDLTGFEEVLKTTSESFQEVEGALESVIESGVSIQDEFDTLRRSLTLTLSDIGQQIADAIDLSAVVDTLTGALETVRDGFNNLPESLQAAIGTFLGFSSAIAAIAPVVGIISTALSAFNPVVIAIVASVAALSAAFVAFRDIMPQLDLSGFSAAFEGLQQAFAPLVETIGELGSALLGAVGDVLGISDAFSLVVGEGQSLNDLILNISQSVIDFSTQAIEGFTSFVEAVNTALGGIDPSVVKRAIGPIISLFQEFQALAQSAFSALVAALGAAFDTIVNVVSQLDLTPILSALQGFGAVAAGIFLTLADLSGSLITALASVYDAISQLFESGGDFSALSDIAVTAFQAVIDIVGNVINGLTDALTIIDDLLNGAISPLDAFVSLWEVQFSLIESATQTALDAALSVIETVVTDIGPLIQSGLESAMQMASIAWAEFSPLAYEALNDTLTVVGSVLSELPTVILDSLGQAALFVGEALADVGALIGEALSDVGQAVATALSESFSDASSSVSDALGGVADSISAAFAAAVESASTALAPIVDVTRAILETMVSLWDNILGPIIRIVNATLSAVGAIIGVAIEEIVETARVAFAPIVSVVTEALSVLSSALFTGLSGIAGIVSGALSPVLAAFQTALSGLLNVVTTVMTAVSSAFTSALTALSGVVSSALTSVLTSFQTTLNGLLNIVTTVMTGVRTAFTNALSTLGGIATNALGAVRVAFTSAFNTVAQTVTNGVNRVQTTLSMLRTVFNNAGVILRSFEASWQTTLNNVVSIVTTAFTNAGNTIRTAMTTAQYAISTALTAISSTFTTVTTTIRSTVTTTFNAVQEAVTSVMNSVSSTTSSILQSVSSTFSSAWDEVRSTVSAALLSVQSTVSGTMNAVLSAVQSGVDSVVNAFRSGFNSLAGIVSSAMSTVSGAISSGLSTALSAAQGLIVRFTNIGTQIAEGIATGIRQAAGRLAQEAVNAVQNALSSAAQALGIASPSKVSEEEIGEPIGQGITLGTIKALDTLAGDVSQAIDGAFSAIGDGLPDITANVGFNDTTDTPSTTTINTVQRIEITVSVSSDDTLADQLSDVLTDLLGTDISLSDSLGLIAGS